MRILTLVTLAVGATAQQGGPNVVLPSNGRHHVFSPSDVRDRDNVVQRQEYRNKFAEINPFSDVDFNVTPSRPTGQSTLATRENFVTEEISAHSSAEPNQNCPTICTFEDRQI